MELIALPRSLGKFAITFRYRFPWTIATVAISHFLLAGKYGNFGNAAYARFSSLLNLVLPTIRWDGDSLSRIKNTRRLLSWAWIHFLDLTGAFSWVRRRIAASAGVLVLTFHRVLDDSEFDESDSPAGMIVRRRTFENLLAYLKEHFEIIVLSGDQPVWEPEGDRIRMALTFDDGWADTFQLAYPLARQYGVSFSLFVCPGLAGLPSPFWPETIGRAWKAASKSLEAGAAFSAICGHSGLSAERWSNGGDLQGFLSSVKELPAKDRDLLVDQLRVFAHEYGTDKKISDLEATMTWENTGALSLKAMQIGFHNQHHENLTHIPLNQAKREIGESKTDIESHLGISCRMCAYPNGSWSPSIRDLVEQRGYSQAFSNKPGIWTKRTDPFIIPRVNVWEGSLTNSSGNFSSKLFAYSVLWRAYRGR